MKSTKNNKKGILVIIRHGQTQFNLDKIFCGWTDVDLTEKGAENALEAGKKLASHNISFDCTYTSYLKRSIDTLYLVLKGLNQQWITEYKVWQFNERHYGALQGIRHAEKIEEFGEDQVQKWRRSFDVRPPLLEPKDPRNPIYEVKYKDIDQSLLPLGESLKDTITRVLPVFQSEIMTKINRGQNVLLSAHGNSLRAIVKHLENISDADIPHLNIPTAQPILYTFDSNLKASKGKYL